LKYYKVSIIGSPLESFTYHSKDIITPGLKVGLEFNKKTTDGIVICECEKPDFETNEILELSSFLYSQKQIELAQFIASYYICSLGDVFGMMTPYNLEVMNQEKTLRTNDCTISLSQKQETAITFLNQHKTSLLFGDTGSGKTEIYMKLFEKNCLENKRSIFLMPEISLTRARR